MKNIIFFDLETTGVNTVKDRIVQIAAIKLSPFDYKVLDKLNLLINPGIKISAEAIEVHGITDEMVSGEPIFSDVATRIRNFFYEDTLAGYNIMKFDVPMLAEEFQRVGVEFPAPSVEFIDVFKLFQELMPRTLAGAYSFYVDGGFENAHDAEADVDATIKVLIGMKNKHTDLEPDKMFEISKPKGMADLSGYFIKNEEGELIFNFGKHKGKKAANERDYLYWMFGNDFPSDTKKLISAYL